VVPEPLVPEPVVPEPLVPEPLVPEPGTPTAVQVVFPASSVEQFQPAPPVTPGLSLTHTTVPFCAMQLHPPCPSGVCTHFFAALGRPSQTHASVLGPQITAVSGFPTQ
jgi:hypothetical protein